jgi:hypothetical protein
MDGTTISIPLNIPNERKQRARSRKHRIYIFSNAELIIYSTGKILIDFPMGKCPFFASTDSDNRKRQLAHRELLCCRDSPINYNRNLPSQSKVIVIDGAGRNSVPAVLLVA